MAKKSSSSKKHSAVPPTAAAKPATPAMLPETKTAAESPVIAAKPATAQPTVAATKKPATSNPAAIQSTVDALTSFDADIARDAATSLGSSANAAAVEPLINVIRNNDGYFHSVVRTAAAFSLGQLGDVRAVDSLIAAIGDPMAEASAEAVRALATLRDARAVAPLIDVLRNTNGFYLPIVRRAAATALGQLGGTSAIAALREFAANASEDTVVREAAEQAFRQTTSASRAH